MRNMLFWICVNTISALPSRIRNSTSTMHLSGWCCVVLSFMRFQMIAMIAENNALKTGKVTPSGWFSERPDDPQLPLYTRLDFPEPLAGVVFGVLRADEQKFSGVVEEAELLPGLPVRGNSEAAKASENWPEVLTQWSAVCEGLAEDFMAGHATVNPKQGPVTCDKSYCGLAPLCRIHTAVDALVPGDEP